MEKPVTHRRLCVNVLALAVIAMRVTPTVAGVEAGQFPSNEESAALPSDGRSEVVT